MSEPVPDPQTKVCPQCAEEVKAAARVCRFCSHQFEPLLDGPAPVQPAASPSEQHSSAASADGQKVAATRPSTKPPWARAIVLTVVVWAVVILWAIPTISHSLSIGSTTAPDPATVPWSQLTPGDQLARYGQCESQVALAALAGKFPMETDAATWCLTHQKDNPASWPHS